MQTADPGAPNGDDSRATRNRADLFAVARLHRPLLRRSLIVLLPVALTVSAAAALTTYLPFDPWVTRRVQQIANPAFRDLMIAISWPGYDFHPLIIVPGIAVLLLLWRHRAEAVGLGISAAGASLLGYLIKNAVARPRPVATLANIYLHHSTMSFPSGHVLSYTATYGFLLYVVSVSFPRSWARSLLMMLFGTLVGLVGLSRVYLGAHWTSDVIGGYSLGLVWLILMIELYWEIKLREFAAAAGRQKAD